MSADAAIVRVEGLCVRFGSRAALDGVTLTVPRGAIVGLVGPNGAGKTTLLRVLATALVPTAGSARVAGYDPVRQPREVRRRIGYLPDFMGLYQDMRVDEYLGFFADAYGLDAERRRAFVARGLGIAGLADRAGAYIDELSLGMRARIAFARTLAGDPALLLLDEPLSGLDPFAKTDLVAALRALRDEGRSVLVSSHQLADLERLCDDVVLMDRGRVVGAESAGRDRRPRWVAVLAAAADGEPLRGLPEVAAVEPIPAADRSFAVALADGVEPAAALRAIVLAGIGVEQWRPRELDLEARLRAAVAKEGTP